MSLLEIRRSAHIPATRAEEPAVATTHAKPALLLPGILNPESALLLVGSRLKQETGYKPYSLRGKTRWNLVYGQERAIKQRIDELSDKHESPIAIVGYSLGGRQGATVAFENPEMVDEVVTLFSPVSDLKDKPEEVRATAIFSNADLIVNRWISSNQEWDRNERVEWVSHPGVLWRGRALEPVRRTLRNSPHRDW